MMELVIIMAALLVALLAIVVPVFLWMRSRKAYRALPEERIIATFRGLDQQEEYESDSTSRMASVDNTRNHRTIRHYAVFRTDKGRKLMFRMGRNDKRLGGVSAGDQGYLVVKGQTFIRFEKTQNANPKPAPYFFVNKHKSATTVKFFAFAPTLGLFMETTQAIRCDYAEVCSYLDRILENTEDNFCGLENDRGDVLYFMHNGVDPRIEVEIPISGSRAYRRILKSVDEAKDLVAKFIEGVDLPMSIGLVSEEH